MGDRVFQRRIMTVKELEQVIAEEVAAVDEALRRRVYDNFHQRSLHECIDVNGTPFSRFSF